MAATAFPVSDDELRRRAGQCHAELLAAKVTLTTPPVSRLQVETIEPTGAKDGRITGAKLVFSFTVDESDCNAWRTLHGGCVFTICNAAGKIAAAVVAAGARNLVSTDLTTHYLAGVPVGATVAVEIECLRTTRSIAFLRGSIRDAAGNLCYMCVQNVSFEL
ncbi:hypothetical protein IWQ57_005070 [Coemansia nantahalensis]|uniref:Uncharacterized protein n=2 Tax=Coemansia TaxID=4863 RepID=A0ACC1L614_9FUNG|nr:hypothetical protein IWQ57_005070 [Coemansia nantahalensis]KAJ2801591.1 hypothetical protein H4R21_002742 [Coemansia helicoidea]